jgi:hypothetical protein
VSAAVNDHFGDLRPILADDLAAFVREDDRDRSLTVVREPGDPDIEGQARRWVRQLRHADADIEACAAMQIIVDRHADGSREEQRAGIVAALRFDERGHAGLAAALDVLWSVRAKDARDFWRMVESGRRVVLAKPSPKTEYGCNCPGAHDKIDRPPKAEKAPDQGESGEPAGEPARPTTADEDDSEARKFARAVEAAAHAQRVSRAARRAVEAEERGETPPPSSTSLAALLAEEPNTAKYRIDQLWPSAGKVLITAAKKSGKTTMIGNLIRCLVDCDRFLGHPFDPVRSDQTGFAVTPDERRVFLLDFEMTRDMLREWLRDQAIGGVDRIHVELMRGRTLDLRDDNVRAQWAAYLRSLDVGTLIIDPIGPVIHGLGIDENDNSEVGAFLTALDKLCLEAGVAEYAVVHHAGHGEEQRARGASAFVGWPDAWWQITRSEDGSFLRAEGRDVAVDETHLVFNGATRHLTLGEGNRRDAKGAADVEAVVQMVKDNPGASRNDLAKLLRESDGWGTERARTAIAAAVKTSVVHHHPGANRAHFHHIGGACERCPTLQID